MKKNENWLQADKSVPIVAPPIPEYPHSHMPLLQRGSSCVGRDRSIRDLQFQTNGAWRKKMIRGGFRRVG